MSNKQATLLLCALSATMLIACGRYETPSVPPTASTQPAGEVALQPAVGYPPAAQVQAEEQHVAQVVAKPADSAVKTTPAGQKKSAEVVNTGDKMAAKVADSAEVVSAKVEAVVVAQPPVAKKDDGATQTAVEMPDLAKKNGCTACHKIDVKMVGPAWRDVAKKYQGVTEYAYSPKGSAAPDAQQLPLVEGMMMKVSKGGAGNWGAAAMIANDPTGKKQDQIKELVEFVLGLAK